MDPINSLAKAGVDAKAPTETASAEQADSLITPGQEPKTLDERLSGANTPDDVRRIIEEARAGKYNAKPDEQAEASPDEPGAEKPPGPSTEKTAVEAEPGEKPETPPAEAKGEKTETEEESEGKLPERIRLSNFKPYEKLAMQLKRETPELSLAEAETRAKAALGIKDEPKTETGQTDTQPQTIAETEAKIAELETQVDTAWDELNFKAARQLQKEVKALEAHRATLRDSEAKAQMDKRSAYDTAFEAAQARAASHYDFANQPESEEFKRMVEIDRQLEANRDPLFHDPEKPLRIAQMVAREKSIAPKSAMATPAANKAASPATSRKAVPPVASGASRTSTTTTQGSQLSAEIDSIRTPADMEKFLARLGANRG